MYLLGCQQDASGVLRRFGSMNTTTSHGKDEFERYMKELGMELVLPTPGK